MTALHDLAEALRTGQSLLPWCVRWAPDGDADAAVWRAWESAVDIANIVQLLEPHARPLRLASGYHDEDFASSMQDMRDLYVIGTNSCPDRIIDMDTLFADEFRKAVPCPRFDDLVNKRSMAPSNHP